MAHPSEYVKPGSVWSDNTQAGRGRTVRVDLVEAQYAFCTVLTNRGGARRSQLGKPARVLLNAFRPEAARTGYSPATERQLAIVREIGSLDLPNPWSTTE